MGWREVEGVGSYCLMGEVSVWGDAKGPGDG